MHMLRFCFVLLLWSFSQGILFAETPAEPNKAKSEPQASRSAVAAQIEEEETLELKYRIDKQPTQSMTAPVSQTSELLWDILRKSVAVAQGKLGAAVTTQVFIPYSTNMLASLQGSPPDLMMKTLVGPGGKGHTDFAIEAYTSPIKEGDKTGNLVWKGLQGNMQFSGELQSPSANFSAPGLRLSLQDDFKVDLQDMRFDAIFNQYAEPLKMHGYLPFAKLVTEKDGALVMKGGRFEMDFEEPIEGLKVGTAEGQLQSLDLTGKGNHIQIKELGLDYSVQLKPDSRVDYDLHFKVANMKVDIPTEKDALKEITLRATLEVNAIDSTVVADLQKASRQMAAQNMPPDMMGMALIGQFMQSSPKLVAASPSLALSDFYLNTELGRLSINFKAVIDGNKPFPFDRPDLMKMALDAEAKLMITKPLLKRILALNVQEKVKKAAEKGMKLPSAVKIAETQIKTYVAQRFLVESKGDYVMEATLHDGKLLLNGLEIPLPY